MDSVLQAASPESVGLSSQGLAAVDEALTALVDSGELAGYVSLVARHGKVVHRATVGKKDLASGEPLAQDTIFRIFSMTKPVMAVAMMILHDEGRWRPEDPIAKHLPALADRQVFAGLDDAGQMKLEPAHHAPTMAELMTHTAGFLYGFNPADPVDKLYAEERLLASDSLAQMVEKLGRLPLAYQPGTKWVYSLSMDIQGAVVEALTGQSLPDFMHERIFKPLGMVDTGFSLVEAQLPRLATLYRGMPDGSLEAVKRAMMLAEPLKVPGAASGGGGLASTLDDYARFAQMLLNRGELGGVRIISEAAAKQMMTNHLSDPLINGRFMVGRQRIRPGFGYGYDGAVFYDPAAAKIPVGKGTYQWDGAAGTWFWVDPENDLIYVAMIQRLGGLEAPGTAHQELTQKLIAPAIVGP